jgi:hypothetical protein
MITGLVAAVLAPVVMNDQSGQHMPNEPRVGSEMP